MVAAGVEEERRRGDRGGEGKLRVASSPRICSSFLAVDVILAAIPWKPPVSFISSGAAWLSVIENRWLKTIRDEGGRMMARERLFFRVERDAGRIG